RGSSEGLFHRRPYQIEGTIPGSSLAEPILTERSQAGQRFLVFLAIGRRLAGDDIVDVTDGKPFYLHVPLPGCGETLDTIGGKDKVQVEGAVLHRISCACRYSNAAIT